MEKPELNVLDCAGTDGAGGLWVYFGAPEAGIRAAVLDIDWSCSGVGVGILVDWKMGAEKDKSLAE